MLHRMTRAPQGLRRSLHGTRSFRASTSTPHDDLPEAESTELVRLPQLAQLHNPIHRFFHILDGLAHEPLSSLFVPEATLHIQKADAVLSGDQIDAWCARMRSTWAGAATLHTEGNLVFSSGPGPGSVANLSSWQALINGEITAYGTHEDWLEERDGVWLFRKRVVRHLYARA